jgi:hypothetical protein
MGRTSSNASITSKGPLYELCASFSPKSSPSEPRSLFVPIDDDELQSFKSSPSTSFATNTSAHDFPPPGNPAGLLSNSIDILSILQNFPWKKEEEEEGKGEEEKGRKEWV